MTAHHILAHLQAHLSSLNMDTRGKKSELVSRLTAVLPALRSASGVEQQVPTTATIGAVSPSKTHPARSNEASANDDGDESGSADELDLAEALLAKGLGTDALKHNVRSINTAATTPPAVGASTTAVPHITPGTQAFVRDMATAKVKASICLC